MQNLVDEYEYIMAFTDGCSLDNPGKSGAGVSFYGIKPGPRLKKLKVESSGSELSDFSQADEKLT
jgi:ribonuclease HI